MKKNYIWLLIIPFLATYCSKRSEKPVVLVFTKTEGFHHGSIAAGVTAIQKLGKENNFDVDTTAYANAFAEDNLKKYSAVIFLNTTGNVLNTEQEADFERYIQAGGGYVGVHAATDAEYDWGWYGRLAGGYFNGHPATQQAQVLVADAKQNSTAHLPSPWKRTDEWYNFKKLNPDVHVLLTLDETSYQGGTNGNSHPVAWSHEYDGGRAWYTALGHTQESYSDPDYLKHLLGGIFYAIGDNHKPNYDKATTQRVPNEQRFTKTALSTGVFAEPTEMTILPNLDILVAQRHGEISLYKNETKTVTQAGKLNVYWKTNHTPDVNAEEGLLGIQADPDFASNHFVYMFYSPTDTSVNRLSRFTFLHDSINTKSEKIILQFYSQREICCHTGGSITFGKDHLLFVSTGDNTTPFDEKNVPFPSRGFGPQDDRPGHTQYDGRRSPGNTNDLRGKILRIKINPDGSYDIPDGNLFAKGLPNTRPEIYVMGNRNPYRISVDKHNGYLYWGEVGPDANNDSLATRGPRGYDEINQARKAGFFGWPLFVGNNFPYHPHDYQTNNNGTAYDPAKPINNSRNNTGLKELPPAQPAFLWYAYDKSSDFPQLGSGGRTAMGGPSFYSDIYPRETRLPDYYNGKVFIYDFIRQWFKVVSLQPNGDFDKMEPFMEHTKFHSPIDAEMGPDGRLYILEYGDGWFTKNKDAGVSRIDFNAGNLSPKIDSLIIDKTSGLLPLTVKVNVKASDLEHDSISYLWDLGNGHTEKTMIPELTYTYTSPGEFNVFVKATDTKNASSKSETIAVVAGNDVPVVSILIKGNKSFYFEGKPVNYNVTIEDKADDTKTVDAASLVVSADYRATPDRAGIPQGHQRLSLAAEGKNLMLSLDCKSCHKIDEKSIGPSFTSVALRYGKDPKMIDNLTQKVLAGGSGVWGEVAMPAHPALKEEDARKIINWVRTLSPDTQGTKSLPASGSLNPSLDKLIEDRGVLTISASYTNHGSELARPLTGNGYVSLQNSKINFQTARSVQTNIKVGPVNLDQITGVELGIELGARPAAPSVLEVHLDTPDGKTLAVLTVDAGSSFTVSPNGRQATVVKSGLSPLNDGKYHTLVFVNAKSQETITPAFVKYVRFLE